MPQGLPVPDIASAPEVTLEIVKQNPLYPGIAEVEVGLCCFIHPYFMHQMQTRGLQEGLCLAGGHLAEGAAHQG